MVKNISCTYLKCEKEDKEMSFVFPSCKYLWHISLFYTSWRRYIGVLWIYVGVLWEWDKAWEVGVSLMELGHILFWSE